MQTSMQMTIMQSSPPSTLPSANLSASTPLDTPPIELAEQILVFAAHFIPHNDERLATILNVLPRSAAPLVTKHVLVRMPHINLNVATKLGNVDLLDFMLNWSKQPRGRPIHYSPRQTARATESVQVLDWWYRSGLSVYWRFVQGAEESSPKCNVQVMDWWLRRGLPLLERQKHDMRTLVADASRFGQVAELEWLLANVGRAQIGGESPGSGEDLLWPYYAEPAGRTTGAMYAAAEQGHVHVLDWWWSKAEAGQVMWPAMDGIIPAAFKNNQIAVLEWCESHPRVIDQYHKFALEKKVAMGWILKASRHNSASLIGWIDRLGITELGGNEYNMKGRLASPLTPFECGNLAAVKWLHGSGRLVASRQESVYAAAMAPTAAAAMEMLDWIHANVGPDALECLTLKGDAKRMYDDRTLRQLGVLSDPFDSALETGSIEVLDWLLVHGYSLSRDPMHIRQYLLHASSHCGTQVLDWLHSKTQQLHIKVPELEAQRYSRMLDHDTILCRTTVKGQVNVLAWWYARWTAGGTVDRLPAAASFFGLEEPLLRMCYLGRTDVLEWWVRKSGMRIRFDLYAQVCGQYPGFYPSQDPDELGGRQLEINHARQMDLLNICFQAGYPITDPAACIHAACAVGNTKALDWLLNVAQVPMDTFLDVYTGKVTIPTQSRSHAPTRRNWDKGWTATGHGKSDMWWWSNVPAVCGLATEVYALPCHPIHLFVLRRVLKVPGVQVLDPAQYSIGSIFPSEGEYLVQAGEWEVLQNARDTCLIAATENGDLVELEWWRTRSRVQLKRPSALDLGSKSIRGLRAAADVKKWWADSGLL